MKSEIPGLEYLPFLKAKDAAEYLGISDQLLWMLKNAKAIPFYQLKPKARIVYPIDGLNLWSKNNRHDTVGKRGGFYE